MSHAGDATASHLLLEAVRADVRRRVEAIVQQLEADVDRLERPEQIEPLLRSALGQVTDVLAEGIVAHVREARRGGSARPIP